MKPNMPEAGHKQAPASDIRTTGPEQFEEKRTAVFRPELRKNKEPDRSSMPWSGEPI
jgi:hypothetical protein